MKRKVRALALLLACLLLSACRESPVLTETVYQYTAPEVDEDEEMLDPEDDGAEDEDFSNETEDEAETPREEEADAGFAAQPEEAPPADSAVEVGYNPNAGNEWQSAESPTNAAQDDGGAAEPEPSEAEPEENGGGGGESAVLVPGDETALKQVVDGAGRTVELPENVETVTATGLAAQLVVLLGGDGRLIGADSAFLGDYALLRAYFPGLGDAQPWWGAEGRISDASFAALLEAAPDACLVWSGEDRFSSAQLAALEAAGIAYVVLPQTSTRENFQTAVTLIGQVLGTVDGVDAAAAASRYNAWVDGVAREVGEKCAGVELSALYIAGWDEGAAYSLNNCGSLEPDGTGLAYAYSPRKNQLVSVFLGAAGVTNESTRIRSLHRDGNYVYVTPMFHQFDPAVSGTKAVFYSGAGEFGAAYDLFVARQVTQNDYYQLGRREFPALIVPDAATKAKIEGSLFWQYRESDSNGFVSIGGDSFYRGVGGPYEIYVNPGSLGSWAEGSVDAPLEAYWAAYRICGTMTLEEVKARAASFYADFLGLALSDAELAAIFGE